MKKIDKSQILSTVYKAWEADLEAQNLAHPKYNSSNGKYYLDIVMNLFYCQNGLCAYTEKELCPPENFDSKAWIEGVYTLGKCDFFGQLEHFDESLKPEKAWLWDNFFMVHSDINIKVKYTKPADYILKPDTENYNPFELLDYDVETNFFTANYGNENLSETERNRIESMIKTLGLNFGPIVNHREKLLRDVQSKIRFNVLVEATSTGEFPTAFQFLMNEIKSF